MAKLNYQTFIFDNSEDKFSLSEPQKKIYKYMFEALHDGHRLYIVNPKGYLSDEVLTKYDNTDFEMDFNDINLSKLKEEDKYYNIFNVKHCLYETYENYQKKLNYIMKKFNKENPTFHFVIIEMDYKNNCFVRGMLKLSLKEGLQVAINPEQIQRMDNIHQKIKTYDREMTIINNWEIELDNLYSLKEYQAKIEATNHSNTDIEL